MIPEIIKYQNKTLYGYSRCPKWLHNKYRKAADYICQDCKKPESKVGKLQPHRIIRGCEKGLYVVVPFGHPMCNQKMVCKLCHEKYNYSRKLPSFTIKKKSYNVTKTTDLKRFTL